MDAQRSDFLTSMIDILERLHQTCVNRGEPLLASVLAIAKGEAEDALRHADELAALDAMREKMSSTKTWRAADQEMMGIGDYADDRYAAVERYADEGYAADARREAAPGYDIADDYRADEDEIAA
jgi:hypothetical protein